MNSIIKAIKAIYNWLMDYSVIDKDSIAITDKPTYLNVVLYRNRHNKCVYIARTTNTDESKIRIYINRYLNHIVHGHKSKKSTKDTIEVRKYLVDNKISLSSHAWEPVVLKSGLTAIEASKYTRETLDVYEDLGFFVLNPCM